MLPWWPLGAPQDTGPVMRALCVVVAMMLPVVGVHGSFAPDQPRPQQPQRRCGLSDNAPVPLEWAIPPQWPRQP